ncbi:MAG: hypothetical protein A3I78_11405 [Gammaproteobacteria bacterium RIFCSPLOWO2_02_FULL_56_15]|nr:MAG: hypothetical protein A3I78_11405 [Gammaproteobacteria bacterium RIFCSPLOWO2_02_FULL_56_15]
MGATARLDSYLYAFRRQLKRLYFLRAASVLSVVLLAIAALGGYLAVVSGFSGATVITARILLLLAMAAVGYVLLLLPLRRLHRSGARLVEQRVPAFAGRIRTYSGLTGEPNPLVALLAEDTLLIADQYPVHEQFRDRERRVPAIITVLSVLTLIWLILAGPGLMKYGVRHLLAGWLVPDLLPPQTILVVPGDEAIRRGGSLHVRASMEGFKPSTAAIHARIGDGDWQEVAMAGAGGDDFEFTFFSIREPISYFVAAGGVRSPGYRIRVVDLPEIESLRLVYHYPEWVQREPEVHLSGGDISTLAGTEIELEMQTNAPLEQAELVLNGATTALEMKDRTGTGRFQIVEDGQYYLSARVGREQVRLSDDYFIKILEDGMPVIKLARPGRDWSASNIEEVTVRIDAEDDFNLASLNLRYSVNGGEWQTIELPAAGREASIDHVFYLEDIRNPGNAESMDAVDGLAPGDLISYYAVAGDRLQTSRTDMYFIDVQSFDRRFFQSQQSGGGGGGQGQREQEISSRQREIIVSTWNLIREQGARPDETATQALNDNATLLSELQNALAGQAQTLAERTRARQLSEEDEQIASFVEHLDLAAEAMQPAAEKLAAVALEDAILPEQEALQHLLRAESIFNDVNVSFQRNRGGGRGGRAGGDLAEMFELEMDLEKNQYETGSRASPDAASEEQDAAMRKLEELARRQQQLADNLQRRQDQNPAQRWQQELLRREAEELQRQLEAMQQQQSGQEQTGSESGSSEGTQAEGSRSELSRRMDSAIRAMNEAAQNMERDADPEQMRRAAEEAQRQLLGARDQLSQTQQEAMQQSFREMRDQADRLYRRQTRVDEVLQNAVRRALAAREDSVRMESGLDPLQEIQLADEKGAMSEDLQRLQREMQTASREYVAVAPEAVRELNTATGKLREAEIDSRMSIAAEYIRMGAAAYIASSESLVTETLRELREGLERAQTLAQGEVNPGQDQMDRTIAQARQLRRDMQGLQENAATGGVDGWRTDFNAPPEELRASLERGVRDTARAVWSAMPELQRRGVSPGVLDDIRRIASLLDMSRFSRNNRILEREYNSVLTLLEQLEYQLQEGARSDRPPSVRSAVPEQIPGEYRNAVAEYYRRLSRRDSEQAAGD